MGHPLRQPIRRSPRISRDIKYRDIVHYLIRTCEVNELVCGQIMEFTDFQRDCIKSIRMCDATCEECHEDIKWILKEKEKAQSELKILPPKGKERKQKDKQVAQLCGDEKYIRDVLRVYIDSKKTLQEAARLHEIYIDPRPEGEHASLACVITPWMWLRERLWGNNAHTTDPLRQPLIRSVYL